MRPRVAELQAALERLHCARAKLGHVTDQEMIDATIHEIKAEEHRVNYLLRQERTANQGGVA